ncbi:MAG: Flp pilus assembly complex ATPase component TadA [Firmicutes bacterium]|nr:Flp pilus assembly complex ATPase component TadA [Bacillota bacterium]
MEEFYLADYLRKNGRIDARASPDYPSLCARVRSAFLREWDEKGDLSAILQLQKRAIIGYENEVSYFKQKIKALLEEYEAENTEYPPWYESLEDAIYHENWGLAGVAQWFSEAYRGSSSAKLIGDRIYFLKEGTMTLMPQTISKNRREQLIRAFLLLTPQERLDKDFHEVYLLDGTRITIFTGSMVKQNQEVIIFRRYVVPRYTFEEQAERGTIPAEGAELFPLMVKLGYNIVFTGAVRSAKTTFLSTWQSYENPALEGVMIETDPEIPMERLMPGAPVVQILADHERLSAVSKNLLRSDADYIILAEARDGIALELALRMAAKGTRRMKMTFHCKNPLKFPWDVAWEITKISSADLETTAEKAAESFDYLFHFVQLKDKSRKRLRGIYEISRDLESGQIRIVPICLYDFETDRWGWNFHLSEEKMLAGKEEDREVFGAFESKLRILSETYPMSTGEALHGSGKEESCG